MRNLPYNRAERVGKQIYQMIAAHVYEDIDDERLSGIQLTSVQMTKDLSLARVYFYIEGGIEKQNKCKEALEKLELRRYIAPQLRLKTIPRLEFYIDEGIENSERVGELLKELENVKPET